MLESLGEILLVVSTSLLLPVIVALLGLVAWTALLLGGLLRELLARKVGASGGGGIGFIPIFLERRAAGESAGRIIEEIELEMGRRVSLLLTLARVGPMLGLMGTLIPLGPALVALANGRIDVLAGQLVIAFGTTVAGLLTGLCAFVSAQVRRAWYARDLLRIQDLGRAGEAR